PRTRCPCARQSPHKHNRKRAGYTAARCRMHVEATSVPCSCKLKKGTKANLEVPPQLPQRSAFEGVSERRGALRWRVRLANDREHTLRWLRVANLETARAPRRHVPLLASST